MTDENHETVKYDQYQQRVIEEKAALDERGAKLADFVISETFNGLPDVHRDLLQRQLVVMGDYSSILAARIDLFTSDYAPKPETGVPPPETAAPKYDTDNDWKK